MALFKLSHFQSLYRRIHPTPPASPSGQALTSQPRRSITELEQQLAAAQRLNAQVVQASQPVQPKRSPLKKIITPFILLGLPVGILWVLNLPYATIRRPIAEKAPILLLPSHISLDHHYRQAITTLEQAQQLIDNATAPADLDLGEQKLQQAQKSLDALPVGWINDSFYSSYRVYDWRFSTSNFNQARTEAGRLKAKVFQEKNAQNAWVDAEQSLTIAQQKYSQAKTTVDRQTAIAQWRTALVQLEQIPGDTLAGHSAQQTLPSQQQNFQETVGMAAGNQRILSLISAAREYSSRAAQQGQNPPHTAAEWRQIMELWNKAIDQVSQIPSDDPIGYAEAQRMAAEYQQNLGMIEIRLDAEEESMRAFDQAQHKIANLLANANNPSYTVSQLQSIINQLKQVQPGTTRYLEAQADLQSAQNKLQQMRSPH
jgi:hypothetical protein